MDSQDTPNPAQDLVGESPSEKVESSQQAEDTAAVGWDGPPQQNDERSWPKQRRKRTSPEDQAVLEAAYQRDAKPDKAARQDIVSRVALTEKEVQIWFQNRRQSSRRKSRPLLPHEIIQYQLSRTESAQSSNGHHFLGTSQLPYDPSLIQPLQDAPSTRATEVTSSGPMQINTSAEPNPPSSSQPEAQVHTLADRYDCEERPQIPSTASTDTSAIGYLANRRSAHSLSRSQSDVACSQSSSQNNSLLETSQSVSTRRLRKSSSHVRLSMSFEGNASVISSNSPSPPRAPPILFSSSQPNTEAELSQPAGKSLQRSISGRSRDSRAWEFWCDRDARNELGEKANKIASGSAADAIGLLRSASGRSILGPASSKRNSLLSRQPSDIKRAKIDLDARPFRRSSTFGGHPSHDAAKPTKSFTKARPKLKYSESAVSVHVAGNDSDKENWTPGQYRSLTHRGDEGEAMKGRESGRDQLNSKRVAASQQEHDDPENDPEVATFMRGGRKSSSISSEDDLDCIQGLLSLSQGNWR